MTREAPAPIRSTGSPWTPDRRQRFGLWIGAVALTLGSPWIALASESAAAPAAADAIALLGLGCMLILLATTPADAIRLPRWASWLIIALGTVWMTGSRLGPFVTGTPDSSALARIGETASIGVAYSAATMLAVASVWAVRHVHDLTRPARQGIRDRAPEPSPWRVVLYAWHPALPLVAVAPFQLDAPGFTATSGIFAALALLLVAGAADDAIRPGFRWRRPVQLFTTSALIALTARGLSPA